MTKTYELVEVDPATGEDDQILGTGTMAQMERERARLLAEFEDDWDTFEQAWPVTRIQPAA